jgi:hypothetical protein
MFFTPGGMTMTRLRFRQMLVVMASLFVAACLLTPGKFTSALDVRRDGAFTYSYTGEIHLLALSKLADMGRSSDTFTASTCTNPETGNIRECSREELAIQKSEWEAERTRSAERKRRDTDSMKAMLGGIDPGNPRAAEELAARLRRQAGWRRVDYKGDGLFDVDFVLSGRMDRDFSFPTIERFPTANAFVTVSRRSDGTLRIDAPGFAPASAGEPFRGMMGGLAAMGSSKNADGSGSTSRQVPGMPMPDGMFTLTTDAAIMANNTDEGPQADPRGQKLSWAISTRTTAAPMALLRLTPQP